MTTILWVKTTSENYYRMLLSIGVDVGTKNGAIAVIDEDFNILHLGKAPYFEKDMAHTARNRVKPKLNKETGKYEITYKKRSWTDFHAFRGLFKPYIARKYKIIYTVEKVSVRPEEGEISSFVFGNSLGCFEGLSAYLNPIFMVEPTPQTWKSEMGLNSTKSNSIELAESLFEVNLKDYVQKGKVDDISEALLLAVYGFKKYDESTGEQ